MGMNGTLGMISGILNAIDRRRFERLITFGQLLYRFVVGVFDSGQSLRIAALAGAVLTNLPRIRSQFV
jgi:hypothetical protein